MAASFSFTGRMRSVRHAVHGIQLMLASQHNAWVHAGVTLLVLALGVVLGIDRYEWCWLTIACVAVWTAEGLNTAFEFLCDVASPQFDPAVKSAKDVAAGAVLIAALGAAVIGLLILGPPLLATLTAS
jgi:diacylglycerol kinase (ATP)